MLLAFAAKSESHAEARVATAGSKKCTAASRRASAMRRSLRDGAGCAIESAAATTRRSIRQAQAEVARTYGALDGPASDVAPANVTGWTPTAAHPADRAGKTVLHRSFRRAPCTG